MKTLWLMAVLAGAALATTGERREQMTPSAKPQPSTNQFCMVPIGHIENRAGRASIQIDARHQEGLLGMDQWSHIWVFYWFDRNDTPERRSVLRVHPRGNRDNPITGVFATRSPMRPNLIALSLCRVISIKGNEIEVESIDALDKTPVLDIKPYAQGPDSPQGKLKSPDWAERKQPK